MLPSSLISNLANRPSDDLGQLVNVDRLQHILDNSELDRFLGIFKFAMIGQYDTFGLREANLHPLDQFDPIHHRHPNIGNQQIRHMPLHLRKRLLAVLRYPCYLKPELLPVDVMNKGVSDDFHILDNMQI
ncbi:hypothetical protein D3C73_1135380 [compost metagenome]